MGEGGSVMMLLPVTYQNKELELEFDIQRGYVLRVGVKVGDVLVIFEPKLLNSPA